MSLMANLYVGTSGLQTSQQALNTTAHNMANLDTQGYTRQQVSLGTRMYQTLERKMEPIAWKQIGDGVYYSNCKQVRSVFLDAAFRQETGRYSFYDVSLKAIEEIEDQLQEMNGSEFAQSLNNLWVSVQELSKDPCSAVTQSSFITRSSEFITRAKSVYEGLVSYQENLDSTIEGMCNTINSYGERIRVLNEKIVDIEAGGRESANDYRDERNDLLDQPDAVCRSLPGIGADACLDNGRRGQRSRAAVCLFDGPWDPVYPLGRFDRLSGFGVYVYQEALPRHRDRERFFSHHRRCDDGAGVA